MLPCPYRNFIPLLISPLSKICIYLQNTEAKHYWALEEVLSLLMMPSLLPASSWTPRAPSLSWLHASNKSVWCFCRLSLAAALPDSHFHRKISTSFVFYSAAHKLCLHSAHYHWAVCETYALDSEACCFIYARGEPNTFLTLMKISPNSPTPDFSIDSIHALPQVTDHFWWPAKRQGRGLSLFRCSLLWLFSTQESKGQSWSWAWI